MDIKTAPVHVYREHSQLNNFGAIKAKTGAPIIKNGLSLARFLSIHCWVVIVQQQKPTPAAIPVNIPNKA